MNLIMNLIEELQEEIDRCNEILDIYKSIPQGIFGTAMIQADIKAAKSAIATIDTIEMIRCYKKLKNIE